MIFGVIGACAALWLFFLVKTILFTRRKLKISLPEATMTAYPGWWLFQVVSAKILSYFGILTQQSLLISVCLGILAVYLLERYQFQENKRTEILTAVPPQIFTAKGKESKIQWPLELVALFTALSLLLILVTPCRIWDVNTYHLPALAHWIEQKSMDPWPSENMRQVTRTHAGTIQQLFVAGMAHTDALVELPSLLASLVMACFCWSMAIRWNLTRQEACIAVLAVWATPQIVYTSISAGDDTMFSAIVLCSVYLALQFMMGSRNLVFLILSALSVTLAIGTKIPGLLVGPAIAICTLWNISKKGTKKEAIIYLLALVIFSFPTFALKYFDNLVRYRLVFPEIDYELGRQGSVVLDNAFYYLYIFFCRPIMGVGSCNDLSNFGIALTVFILPVLIGAVIQINWKEYMLQWRESRLSRTQMEKTIVIIFIAISMSLVFMHRLYIWDQRFMTWLALLLWCLGLPELLKLIRPDYLVKIITLFSIYTVISVFLRTEAVIDSTRTLIKTGEFPSSASNGRPAPFSPSNYDAVIAAPTGSRIVYIGGEDTWEYPCHGCHFDRVVWTPVSTESVKDIILNHRADIVVIESDAPDILREFSLKIVAEANYIEIVAPFKNVSPNKWRKVFLKEML